MATMIHDADVDVAAILGRKVAVIGFGSQGHAHSMNLRDSGGDVRVAVRPGSRGWRAAEAAGFTPMEPAAAAAWADVIMMLVPDLVQPGLFKKDIEPHLTPGKMLMFAHGFAIRFNWITPPEGVDVSMVAPKAPGHRVREVFKEGAGVPGLMAIHNDATGTARASDPRLRQGHWLHPRRRDRNDLLGRDGNGSVRRAGGAVRRRERARDGGIRDAGRSRLPA